VTVLATDVAVHFLTFVVAVTGEVPENAAVVALEGRIDVLKIPHSLLGHLVEVVAAL
jgi:hypothetical protein